MSDDRAAMRGVLDALYDAMLDDACWPRASALIDETCGLTGNGLLVQGSPVDDDRVLFVGTYCRGHRRMDEERDYLENYLPTDERARRVARLPDSRLALTQDLYTPDELKTSATYNEMLPRIRGQNSLNVRLDGPAGSSIVWHLHDPVDSAGWPSSRVAMVERLLPHIRQFVRVRQALVRAEAHSTTLTALLDHRRVGIIQLDGSGYILEANHRARTILRRRDGLSDRHGMLRARAPADRARLERLIGAALPAADSVPVSGSVLIRRSSVSPPFLVHVKPVNIPQTDYEARHVAALLLIVEPGRQSPVTPEAVAMALELTPAESRVALWLAEGKSVREMAHATGNTEGAIYWHLKRIYRKHSLSGQADLARLVLSLADFA